MQQKHNRKRTHLKAVAAPKPQEKTYAPIWPAGVPHDTDSLEAVTASDDYLGLGVYEGDILIAWGDAPLSNCDLAILRTRTRTRTRTTLEVGRYHAAPGGYVRLELNEEDGEHYIFKPSDIEYAARVMHIERKGKIVRRFPLKGG